MMSLATDRGTWTIALIGNPNTGKSTLFGALSGIPQRVGNYPGVTVDKTIGEVFHERQTVGPRRPARHLQPRTQVAR